MSRPGNKEDLLKAADENYRKMNQLINLLSVQEMETPFDFSQDEKKKEAHWKRDKNVRDVLGHLYEWHQLMIHFVDENTSGKNTAFLPEIYTWRTISSMNQMFWKKHQGTSFEEARELLARSHREVMDRVKSFSNDELFESKTFTAVGGSVLGSYFVSSTSSHYDWAMKKIKAHQRNCKGK